MQTDGLHLSLAPPMSAVMINPGLNVCRRLRRLRLLLVLTVVACSILEAVHVRQTAAAAETAKEAPADAGETVFVAGIHWNSEQVLRESWVPGVMALVDALGHDRVFVSVYESGSWDGSKAELRHLDALLAARGVPRRIVLDETTHGDAIRQSPSLDDGHGHRPGWIQTPAGDEELRRIPYLAELRNRVLEPLHEEMNKNGSMYDRVLFLGDVVFTTNDVQTLLATRGGDYAAACALDFSHPPLYYDTFALRDSDGHETAMQTWPYFRSRASRHALQHGRPVPVKSCWNGIVAMDAPPFYGASPLQFRGISDGLAASHLEGSECCLIHADNPLSARRGVWLHPGVRVGYNRAAYAAVHPVHGGFWVATGAVWRGLWTNRLRRLLTTPWLKEQVVARRLARWQAQDRDNHTEAGRFCLINEMQVLVENGWAHR